MLDVIQRSTHIPAAIIIVTHKSWGLLLFQKLGNVECIYAIYSGGCMLFASVCYSAFAQWEKVNCHFKGIVGIRF